MTPAPPASPTPPSATTAPASAPTPATTTPTPPAPLGPRADPGPPPPPLLPAHEPTFSLPTSPWFWVPAAALAAVGVTLLVVANQPADPAQAHVTGTVPR